jgi:hypothetical protein
MGEGDIEERGPSGFTVVGEEEEFCVAGIEHRLEPSLFHWPPKSEMGMEKMILP